MQKINDLMTSLFARIQNAKEESGQTLVEYGLIVALLSIVAIAVIATLGDEIVLVFEEVTAGLQDR